MFEEINIGACSTLVTAFQQFGKFIGMSAVQFEMLLNLVKHQVVKQDTNYVM